MALPDPTDVAAGHEPPKESAQAASPPRRARIELRDYDPSWPRLYEREAARIRSALGGAGGAAGACRVDRGARAGGQANY
jgi:hypothetical protein